MNDTPRSDPDERVYFGTFTGVFTPTLLTIFGVILYVRVGWTVGNAGVLGTWLCMLLALGITAATGLSLSSIATNTRIGDGGPYAIMSRSLGIEVGGAIGLPLYLTRPLGVAMYIIGFREGWLWIFPDHSPLVVDLAVFFVLAAVSYVSARFAFKIQYVIMAVIVASLVSIFASPVTWRSPHAVHWWGSFPGFAEDGFGGTDFWGVFAVFFPATTGILAGANMSGDLRDPRRAIPRGTLWAIVLSSVVYFALAYWCALAASPEELVGNYTVVIDRALWPALVLAGLLGATASSALAGLVGGPRILMAMGEHRVVPCAELLARRSPDGNPRAAILVTAALTLGCVMVRDLNAIAPIVTMFFLITYCMLNVVVLVESSLRLVSFRPTLRIPRVIPLLGMTGCIFAMFILNPTFALIAIAVVVAFYFWIERRQKRARGEDVRSSVLVALAQWAASRVREQDHRNVRAWKPNLLIPVIDPEVIRGDFDVLVDMTRPDGSLTLLGLGAEDDEQRRALRGRLLGLSEEFRRAGVQSSAAVLRAQDTVDGIIQSIEALQAAFFRPNALVIPLDEEHTDTTLIARSAIAASDLRVGMMVIAEHPRAGFGRRRRVNMWVRSAPGSWDAEVAFSSGNLNLNLLTGYRLMREWQAEEVRVLTVVRSAHEVAMADAFLRELCDLARFPDRVERQVLTGDFVEHLAAVPIADVNVIGMSPDPDMESMRNWVELLRSSCIYVRDSGGESALA